MSGLLAVQCRWSALVAAPACTRARPYIARLAHVVSSPKLEASLPLAVSVVASIHPAVAGWGVKRKVLRKVTLGGRSKS